MSYRMTFPTLFSILFIVFINTSFVFGEEMQSQQQSAERPKSDQDSDKIDPIKQAHEILDRLTRSGASYMKKAASGFDKERSLRVQQNLLREYLEWLTRGFSSRQIDAMVFVSVALSLEDAIAESEQIASKLQKPVESAEEISKLKKRLKYLISYQMQAMDLLEKLSPKLRDLRTSELRFYF